MIGNVCYDKDGVRAAAVFAEMAVQLEAQGLTPYTQLERLYQTYEYKYYHPRKLSNSHVLNIWHVAVIYITKI